MGSMTYDYAPGGSMMDINQYSPQYDPNMAANQSQNSAGFWKDWLASQQSQGGTGGVGSQVGSAAGGALGSLAGPVGGAIGSQLGGIAGDLVEGGIMGGDESGGDKYAAEKAQSEHETRRWEERNAAPTAGLGNYMTRALMLQNMPMLSMINSLDFFMNKVMPYYNNYMRKGVGQGIKSFNMNRRRKR